MKNFVIIALALTLGACGNTISGVGKDIQGIGDSINEKINGKPIKYLPIAPNPPVQPKKETSI